MARHVRGSLFADYVRMIRARKDVEWDRMLPHDVRYLHDFVREDGWYPMDAFERMGNAILAVIASGNVEAARMWGYMSADHLHTLKPDLVVAGDPLESLMRFRVLRSTFFDFDAIGVREISEGSARIQISYGMGALAEEAASHQTMGFFERVLELAGAKDVAAVLTERAWAGAPTTVLELSWT